MRITFHCPNCFFIDGHSGKQMQVISPAVTSIAANTTQQENIKPLTLDDPTQRRRIEPVRRIHQVGNILSREDIASGQRAHSSVPEKSIHNTLFKYFSRRSASHLRQKRPANRCTHLLPAKPAPDTITTPMQDQNVISIVPDRLAR